MFEEKRMKRRRERDNFSLFSEEEARIMDSMFSFDFLEKEMDEIQNLFEEHERIFDFLGSTELDADPFKKLWTNLQENQQKKLYNNLNSRKKQQLLTIISTTIVYKPRPNIVIYLGNDNEENKQN